MFDPNTIQDAAQIEPYVKMLVYGSPGAGKTYLCCTAPKPFIILTEDEVSKATVRQAQKDLGADIQWVAIKSTDELQSVYDWLEQKGIEEKGYKSICVDGLTDMQRYMQREIIEESKARVKRAGRAPAIRLSDETMDLGEWGIMGARIQNIVRGFRSLPAHFITTALVTALKGEMYDAPMIIPASSARLIPSYFTHVGYLGALIEREGGKQTRTRVLVLEGDQEHVGKNAGAIFEGMEVNPSLTDMLARWENGK